MPGLSRQHDVDRIADGVQQEEDDGADAKDQHHREQQATKQITQDAHGEGLIDTPGVDNHRYRSRIFHV